MQKFAECTCGCGDAAPPDHDQNCAYALDVARAIRRWLAEDNKRIDEEMKKRSQ